MPLQFTVAYFLLPIDLSAPVKFAVLTIATFALSILIYQYILRYTRWMKPLWGIK